MTKSAWLALDVGGANLKAADGRGFAACRPFPLWKERARLTRELADLAASAPAATDWAVTMTGELADCYETKSEGVHHILDCVEQAAIERTVLVYLVTGELVPPAVARQHVNCAAASNWHALASLACRYLAPSARAAHTGPRAPAESYAETPPLGLLIDVGSTTADIIPLSPSQPFTSSKSDIDRLLARELVYTGTRRSPVCAVVNRLPWRHEWCPIAQEVFATTVDVYLLLNALDEDPGDDRTSDGRPLTRRNAHARLARMLCMDIETFQYEDAVRAAEHVRQAQLAELSTALQYVIGQMPQPPRTIVLSGEGEFLARRLVADLVPEPHVVSLTAALGPNVSRAAPAHALAVLARERAGGDA